MACASSSATGVCAIPFFRQIDVGPLGDDTLDAWTNPMAYTVLTDTPRPVVALGADLPALQVGRGPHSHARAQFLLTLRGAVACEAEQGVWIAPTNCAVWIPGDLRHAVTVSGDVELYCLFIDPKAAQNLPRQCGILAVSPLLKQLVLRASQLPPLYDPEGPDGRVMEVLLDELAAARREPLDVPLPLTPRLRRLAESITATPGDRATLSEWAERLGLAPRTLSRMMMRETGLSFGRWRQRVHIAIALQRLAQGATVQAVAFDLGYENPSAFVTMFRKAVGKPPARYLAEHVTRD